VLFTGLFINIDNYIAEILSIPTVTFSFPLREALSNHTVQFFHICRVNPGQIMLYVMGIIVKSYRNSVL